MLNTRRLLGGVLAVLLVMGTVAGCSSPTHPTLSATPVPTPTRVMELSGDLTFGSIPFGTTGTKTLLIANKGDAALTWSVLITGTSAVTSNKTSGVVAAAGSDSLTLTYAPTAEQSDSGTLTVTSNATSSAVRGLPVSGTGVATRILRLDGNVPYKGEPYIYCQLWFPDTRVGSTSALTLTISNDGNSPLTWTSMSFRQDGGPSGSQSDPSPITSGGPASGSVAAKGATRITLTFAPRRASSFNEYFGFISLVANQTIPVTTTNTQSCYYEGAGL